ncbi:hypothetical protein AVEN_237644-1 [Araneus ventricosus]|uniref:Uncharacterized protein n=1 Tax=Araneus ventricosus TaxID=182803 RepID=A0A4Y2VB39_ARAVE|nr:hypothetical protein AVEN_97600-1 [Araneus ventricosus]GBO21585.1 hypothetical protein AVEN_91134-1 [Araneus ventricosus]GBO21604.1 hypothetical protein AVEN_237644-1 [Araneus ventricosus]
MAAVCVGSNGCIYAIRFHPIIFCFVDFKLRIVTLAASQSIKCRLEDPSRGSTPFARATHNRSRAALLGGISEADEHSGREIRFRMAALFGT